VPWVAPVVVDLAELRCPEPDPRARAEFRRVTKPPATGDLDAKEHIDSLRADIARKNATGLRALAEHEKCRGTPPAAAPDSRVKATS
jgi:hypothetical protein